MEKEISTPLNVSLDSNFDTSLIDKKYIDLSSLKIKHLSSKYPAFILNNCFSSEECDSLITSAESGHFSKASVNLGGVESFNDTARSNSRFIVDDKDFASTLWTRIEHFIPQKLKGARVVGLNERLRFLRYHPGELFAPHYDGTYSRENNHLEVSLMTLQIYLNQDFQGGETNFMGDDIGDNIGEDNILLPVNKVSTVPSTGMILAFEQELMHEGAVLKSGVKYTVRTDVMYSYCHY